MTEQRVRSPSPLRLGSVPHVLVSNASLIACLLAPRLVGCIDKSTTPACEGLQEENVGGSPAPGGAGSWDGNDGAAATAPVNPVSSSSFAVSLLSPTEYAFRNVTIGGGGFVTGIVFHPTEPGLLYAYTDISGAFRWEDDESRWIPLLDWVSRDQTDLMGIESLALDPNDSERIYLAAGTYAQSWASFASILRSDDRGATWDVLPAPFHAGGNEPGRGMGPRLVVDPQDSNTLYFGSRLSGLWKSPDRAESWNQVESFPAVDDTENIGIGFLFFDGAGDTLYAAVARSEANLFRTRDGGTTWSEVPGAPEGLIPHRAAVSDDAVVVTYKDGPGPSGVTAGAVYKLDLTEETWTEITPLDSDYFGYGGVALDPDHPDVIVVATLDRYLPHEEILRSLDGGTTWFPLAERSSWDSTSAGYLTEETGYYDVVHWVVDLAIDPFAPSNALFVTGAGIWRSQDLDAADDAPEGDDYPTWTFFNRGLENTVVEDLVSPASGDAHLVSALGDVVGFWHEDLDAPPLPIENPITHCYGALDFAGQHPERMVRVGYDQWNRLGLLAGFSEDGGESWKPLPWIPSGIVDRPGSVALSADGLRVLWMAPGGRAYITSNRGGTWQTAEGLPAFNGSDVEWTNPDPKAAADRVDAHLFYAYDVVGGGLWVSRDGGGHFVQTVSGLFEHPDYMSRVADIHPVPEQEGEVWLTSVDGLYHSDDKGTTVTKLTGIESTYALGFGHPVTGEPTPAIFIGGTIQGESGLFRSSDQGRSWTRINTDAQQFGEVGVITGDPRLPGRVYLGTAGRGIVYGDER